MRNKSEISDVVGTILIAARTVADEWPGHPRVQLLETGMLEIIARMYGVRGSRGASPHVDAFRCMLADLARANPISTTPTELLTRLQDEKSRSITLTFLEPPVTFNWNLTKPLRQSKVYRSGKKGSKPYKITWREAGAENTKFLPDDRAREIAQHVLDVISTNALRRLSLTR